VVADRVQFLPECQLRSAHVGNNEHIITLHIWETLYGYTHHAELVADAMQTLNVVTCGAEFGAKHWGLDCWLLLWQPIDHAIVEEDDKASSWVSAHFVTSMVALW
jgi:hypothetical protein